MSFSIPTTLPARTLTTVLSAIITQDCMVDAVNLMNTSASDATVAIKDAAGKVFEAAFNVPAGTRQQLPLSQAGNPNQQGVYFAGGLYLSASANTAIDVWVAARTQG